MKLIFISIAVLILNVQFSFGQDETEEWKLFRSNEYNFSIQFPDYCTEITTNGPMPEGRKETIKEKGILPFSFDVLKYSVSFGNKVVPIYSISIYDNSENLKLEEFILKIILGCLLVCNYFLI